MAINCDAKIVLFEHIRHIKPVKAAAGRRRLPRFRKAGQVVRNREI